MAHLEVSESSLVPPGGPGGVGRPTQRSESGWEALPEVQEGLGSPAGGLGGVGRGNRWAGRLRESVPEVLEGPRGPSGEPGEVGRPPICLGGVGRTTQISGKPTRRSGRGG